MGYSDEAAVRCAGTKEFAGCDWTVSTRRAPFTKISTSRGVVNLIRASPPRQRNLRKRGSASGYGITPSNEVSRRRSVLRSRRKPPRCRQARGHERHLSATRGTDACERGDAAHPSAPTARWCTALSALEFGARNAYSCCCSAYPNHRLTVEWCVDLVRRPSAPRGRAREKPIASSQLVVRARSTSAFTTADVARLARSLSST